MSHTELREAAAVSLAARNAADGVVDLSANPRIPVLMSMMARLGKAADEPEVLGLFVDAMRRAYGAAEYIGLSTRGLSPGEYRIVRWLGIDGLERVPVMIGRDTAAAVRAGGLLGRIVEGGQPVLLRGLRVRGDPIAGDLFAAFRSLIAAPIYRDGEISDWAILLDGEDGSLTETDLEDLLLRAGLIGAAVQHLETAQRLREANTWIGREIEEIAQIQRAMLPEEMPTIPGVSLRAAYHTYDVAGGDYYTFFPMTHGDSRRWGMLIADASGHGPAAAVVTAMLHTMIYSAPLEDSSERMPSDLLGFLNKRLCARGLERQFATALLCRYDPETRELVYSRAGHPPALIKEWGAEGETQRLDGAGGLPLGVMEDAAYEDASVTLRPGQTAIFYTDGITEARSPSTWKMPATVDDVPEAGWGALALPSEMFGVTGIERSLEACSGEPECAITSIMAAVRTHEAGDRPADDQTIVAIAVDR